MRKFINRPAFALAAAFAIIFLIIVIKSYIEMVDHLTSSVLRNREQNKLILPKSGTIGVEIGPQLLTRTKNAETKITLGTFGALNRTIFLQNGIEYAPFFNEPDKFSDLQNALKSVKHELSGKATKKLDTLGKILDLSFGSSFAENSMTKFHSEISRYRMYSEDSQAVDDLLYDMATQNIRKIEEKDGGTQFKLTVTFNNHVAALFKPMRVSREQQALPNQIYFAEYERHTSEIAAFHLDRVLGFRRALPVIGRKVNLIVEIMRLAAPDLQKQFFISPKPGENVCFIGNCKQFCDEFHPICGNGTMIEGSFMAYFPEYDGTERISKRHPWAQSYSKSTSSSWETNPNYCNEIKALPEFSKGRLLLELIDMSIYDFLTGNMDRHHYQQFEAFLNDTFTLRYDNGRAFGRAFHDELKILAPLLQCCIVRSSTLTNLLRIHNSDEPLSKRMEKSMSTDPIAPVLWPPHLEALDRRLITVLQAIRDCIGRKGAQNVLLPEESADFTNS